MRIKISEREGMLVLLWAKKTNKGIVELNNPKEKKIIAEWNNAEIISYYKEQRYSDLNKLWQKLLKIKRLTSLL